MTETAEVQVKLELDDAASKVADTIKGKFNSLGRTADKLKGEIAGIAKGALQTALGLNLDAGLRGMVDSFKGMVNNAVDVQGRMRAVASYFVAGADVAWDHAMAKAERIDQELYKASIAIGQNIDDARAAFQSLAIQSDGTAAGIEAAAKQTEQLLMFADVTGENVRAIADEWGMMERGMVRTRGKLFKMLYSTGIFGDSVYKASTYWAKLTDEQRSAAMAKAMGTISERFAKAPQTMGSVLAGLDNIKRKLLDVAGMNIIGVLTSKFDRVLKAIEAKRPQLEALAGRFGTFLSRHIEEALKWGGDKLTWLEQNWDDVVKSIEDGAKAIYKAVKFIVENKELIMMAYGLNVMAPSMQMAIAAAPALKAMMLGLKGVAFTSLPAFATSLKAAAASAGTAALKLGAIAAAAAAVYMAFDQYKKLQSEGGFWQAWQELRYGGGTFYSEADIKATQQKMRELLAGGEYEQAAAVRKQMMESIEQKKSQARLKFGKEEAPEHYEAMGIASMEKMLESFATKLPTAADVAFSSTVDTQTQLIENYNQAVKTGNTAMANYLANLAGKSEAMAYGLADSSMQIEGGFDAFLNRLGEKTKEFVLKMNKMYTEQHPQGKPDKAKAAAPSINMSGGQTFNIKQEFREADPDRIALFFRRDLVRAATSRTRARVRTPFGA